MYIYIYIPMQYYITFERASRRDPAPEYLLLKH